MVFCVVCYAQGQVTDFLGIAWKPLLVAPVLVSLCISSLRLELGHVRMLWRSKVGGDSDW